MLTVEQFEALLAKDAPAPREIELPLERALGHALAEEIRAERDSPPFDRAMMDGYAVRSADPGMARTNVDEIPAGRMGTRPLKPGECARIMTGAPVPPGADAVIPHEKTGAEGDRIRLLVSVRPGENIAARAGDARAGDVLLKPGTPLGPAALAAAASAGRAKLRVHARPTVAILATGDELVDAGAPPPRPEQIRNSNGPMVAAQARSAGFEAEHLGIVRDDRGALRDAIARALERHAVLVLTGGVSAGSYDLVIEALKAEGVEPVAHKVALKPGKPIFYGRRGGRRVFGLPGNPLSSFVTFEIFLRPALGRMAGLDLRRPRSRARIDGEVRKAIDRVHAIPARLEAGVATPIFPASSGDILCMNRANAFIMVPVRTTCARGDEVEVLRLDA